MDPKAIKDLSILHKLYTENVKSDTEIEARFGIYDKKGFVPSITYEIYSKIYHFLKTNTKDYKKKTLKQSISIYPGNIKMITTEGESSPVIRKKTKIHVHDIQEYGVRIAFSKEENDIPKPTAKPTSSYTRIRHQFIYDLVTFDIDVNDNNKISIEIESKLPKLDDFMKNINTILYIIQDSQILITDTEKTSVLNFYKKTFTDNKMKFIGVQPLSLKADRISGDYTYAITKKLDGKRYVLLTTNNCLYLMSNNMKNFIRLPYHVNQEASKEVLVDGEYYNGSFYAFDSINSQNSLQMRIDSIKEFFDTVKPYSKFKPNLYIKPYIFSNSVYDDFQKTISELDTRYEDGIILVRSNTTYKNSNPLKWKKVDMITTDFSIKKLKDNVFQYYVQGPKVLQVFHKNTVSKEDYFKYADSSIVECKYVNGDWFPIKSRPDKLKPNYIDIAKDVLETITNPFDVETLKSLVKAPVPLVNMRRFHNYIKRIYIEKLVGENKNVYLLDLASGKGGDFGKYADNGVKYVEAYDIDKNSVEESKRRVETMKTKTKRVLVLTEYDIKQADLNKTELKTGKQFDIIVCNFALHYFYKNIVKFINNVDKNSKVGTKLMFSLFDGDLVVPLDTESFSLKKIGDKEIEVFLKGSVLNTPTKEYIVNIPTLVKKLEAKGFRLEEKINFEDIYPQWAQKYKGNVLSEEEKQFSFMNIVLTFIKH